MDLIIHYDAEADDWLKNEGRLQIGNDEECGGNGWLRRRSDEPTSKHTPIYVCRSLRTRICMKYTKHGKRRAAGRGVSEDVILKAISEPTLSFYDLSSSAAVVFRKLAFITSTAQELIDRKMKNGVWVKIK
ncbi:MAG: hypothetical protein QXL91_04345 [Candidatus Bathyarchaeia archaeon]